MPETYKQVTGAKITQFGSFLNDYTIGVFSASFFFNENVLKDRLRKSSVYRLPLLQFAENTVLMILN